MQVKFPREALLKFEEIKRAGNPKAKGKDRMKHSNFQLPTSGPTITWSDFFNVLLGWAYRANGAADFVKVKEGTRESLEAEMESTLSKIEGTYEAKLVTFTKKIAKADLAHAEANWSLDRQASIARELKSLRASRDGLLSEKADKTAEVEARYEKMLEVRAQMDVRAAALKAKAKAAMEALHTRMPAAGGTSAEDGAKALEAVQPQSRAAEVAAQHARVNALAAAQAVAMPDEATMAANAAELDDVM